MSKRDKRWAEMQARASGWRFDQVESILRSFGFEVGGSGTSHRTFRHPTAEQVVTIPDHGSGTVLPVYVKKAVAAVLNVLAEQETNDAE